MKNKFKIVLVLIGVFLVILAVALNNKNKYNIFYEQYNNNGYYELEISEIKMNRYNEKLNNATIGYLVGNLDIIFNETNEIDNYGIIQYAMLFAAEYDYRFDENVIDIKGSKYIKIKYLKELIRELFNIKIDIKKEKFNIIDEYVELNITRNLITSPFELRVDKILYNKKEETYIAYISFLSVDVQPNLETGEIKNSYFLDSTYAIRYKKRENGINTILQYSKISNKGE